MTSISALGNPITKVNQCFYTKISRTCHRCSDAWKEFLYTVVSTYFQVKELLRHNFYCLATVAVGQSVSAHNVYLKHCLVTTDVQSTENLPKSVTWHWYSPAPWHLWERWHTHCEILIHNNWYTWKLACTFSTSMLPVLHIANGLWKRLCEHWSYPHHLPNCK